MKKLISSFLATGLILSLWALPLSARTYSPSSAMTPELESAVNTQIRHEMEAAYLYLAMSNLFEEQSLFGFSHWFIVQFHEEIIHARLMMKFLADKGNESHLQTIQPISIQKGATALDISEMGLKAEEEQTGRIHTLYELARTAKAYDLETFMSFFVREQVQEEANFTDLKQKLKVVGNSPEGLLALDRELAKRAVPAVQPLPVINPLP